MSQQTLPPGAQQEAKNRRPLLVVALLAVVVLAGLGVYLLTSSGGGEEDLGPVPAPRTTVSAKPSATAAPTPTATLQQVTNKNPFGPLPGASRATTAAPTSGTTAGATTAPTAGTTTSGAAAPTASAATATTLQLVSANQAEQTAVAKVNGKRYDVKAGQTFAKSFQMYAVFPGGCAGFLYGDQNIALCTGSSTVVG
ncbi:MAG: hypothetical protein EPO13_06700 [Actinomycetota bacterium]|nr:MAG: hypothetical protein EPO13_06700 [Actinomycetota bacterium]